MTRNAPRHRSADAGNDLPRPIINLSRRSVRATGLRSGFVEFDFTVGDPLLTVELIMPPAAFAAFCGQEKAVVSVPPAVAAELIAHAALPPGSRIISKQTA